MNIPHRNRKQTFYWIWIGLLCFKHIVRKRRPVQQNFSVIDWSATLCYKILFLLNQVNKSNSSRYYEKPLPLTFLPSCCIFKRWNCELWQDRFDISSYFLLRCHLYFAVAVGLATPAFCLNLNHNTETWLVDLFWVGLNWLKLKRYRMVSRLFENSKILLEFNLQTSLFTEWLFVHLGSDYDQAALKLFTFQTSSQSAWVEPNRADRKTLADLCVAVLF